MRKSIQETETYNRLRRMKLLVTIGGAFNTSFIRQIEEFGHAQFCTKAQLESGHLPRSHVRNLDHLKFLNGPAR